MSEFDRKLHKKIIEDFLTFLNSKTSEYILKGGTSLMLCYGLDRFSEDIDLDCCHQEKFFDYVSEFCKINDYTYINKKDTETVQRVVIHYKDNNLNEVIKPLKIEVSYRNKVIDSNTITKINNYSVYTLDRIATMKTQAYLQRDKIRDMYDICFIVNNKNDEISQNTKNIIQDAFGQKGLEQYDYVCQQEDVLIDKNKLAEDVLNAFDKLDLVNNQNIYQNKK